LIILVIISSLYILKTSYERIGNNFHYASEVSLFNTKKMETEVREEIYQSDAPIWISRIFNNKLTYILRVLRENYLHVFSPQFLFTSGEADGVYSLWWRGQMYIIEFPFILVGLLYLSKLSKRSTVFVVTSILISPLPAALSSSIYSMRSFYMVFFLPIIVAGGILYIGNKIKSSSPHLQLFYISFISILFCSVVLSYLYQYHFRYPTYAAEHWFWAEKKLSQYLWNEKDKYNLIAISNGTITTLLHYSFYNSIDPRLVQETIRNEQDGVLTLGNIHFIRTCYAVDMSTFITPSMLYITKDTCKHNQEPTSSINLPKSIRSIWKIYDGQIISEKLSK